MLSTACPRADELEQIAVGVRVPASLVRHVKSCGRCTQIVDNLRRDANFIRELREAVRERLNQRELDGIQKACDKVVQATRGARDEDA